MILMLDLIQLCVLYSPEIELFIGEPGILTGAELCKILDIPADIEFSMFNRSRPSKLLAAMEIVLEGGSLLFYRVVQ